MKRIIFSTGFSILFVLFLNINNISAQSDTLSFLHITDLHIIFNQDGYHPELIEQRKQRKYLEGEQNFRYFLDNVPSQTNSDFVIATGDLCDFFEASTKDGKFLDLQAEQFSQLIDEYNTPVFLTIGNHDAFTYKWIDNKLHPHQNFAERARAAWIRNISCFKDGTYYNKFYQVGKTKYHLIYLDNIFYRFKEDNDKTSTPYIDKYQLYWLQNILSKSEDEVVIILMHIPFKDDIKNDYKQNELYSLLTSDPSVKLILSGHYHKNSIDTLGIENNNNIIQVQTKAFASGANSWRQIQLTENNISVSSPGTNKKELILNID